MPHFKKFYGPSNLPFQVISLFQVMPLARRRIIVRPFSITLTNPARLKRRQAATRNRRRPNCQPHLLRLHLLQRQLSRRDLSTSLPRLKFSRSVRCKFRRQIGHNTDDPSSNLAQVYNFAVKLLLKRTQINIKRQVLAHLKMAIQQVCFQHFCHKKIRF